MKLLKKLIGSGDKIMLITLPGCGDLYSMIFRFQGIFSKEEAMLAENVGLSWDGYIQIVLILWV